MRIAKSARMRSILGASLAAMVVPGLTNAEIGSNQLYGIDSSSVTGIDSSSVLAIDSSSALSIGKGFVFGIDSSSGLGIDSSSGLGIDSSSGLGIDSSSILGIDSSSVRGIDSSSVNLLVGPIDAINHKGNSFTSLGQTISVPGGEIRNLKVGDLVAVSGVIAGAGRISAERVLISSEQYVPGATQVFVTGIPTNVDYGSGVAKIGDLSVDYTASLARHDFEGIGAAVTVIGTQPVPGGTMMSDRVVDESHLFFVK